MIRSLPVILLAISVVHSAETRSTRDWMDELSFAHLKTHSYIATYRSEVKTKSIEAVVAADRTSGCASLQITMLVDGKSTGSKFWTSGEDEYFIEGGGKKLRVEGFIAEAEFYHSFRSLKTRLGGEEPQLTTQLVPHCLLGKSSVDAGLYGLGSGVPAWAHWVDDGSEVAEVTENSITFRSEEYGLITVGREHGLILRQSIDGNDGTQRVLELVELQLRPGTAKVREISAGWSTLGAEAAADSVKPFETRVEFFQELIDGVESGEFVLSRLEEKLANPVGFRRFAPVGREGRADTLASWNGWQEALQRTRGEIREAWLQTVPDAVGSDPKNFESYLALPDTRIQARDSLVANSMEDASTRASCVSEYLGRGPEAKLRAKTEAGEVAKKMIEDALVRGYLEAILDRKMAEYWGVRAGLD